jgi:hypothetical protein
MALPTVTLMQPPSAFQGGQVYNANGTLLPPPNGSGQYTVTDRATLLALLAAGWTVVSST